jgi:hypothetical protein
MLGFSTEGGNAFLDRYSRERVITLQELDTAVRLYGTMRAYDLWLAKEIYDVGNDRVRRFVSPSQIIPMWVKWEPLRSEIDSISSCARTQPDFRNCHQCKHLAPVWSIRTYFDATF